VPRVRIEWMPVQTYGLGRLGFDHLQLTFEPSEGGLAPQDDWFVMEGVRDHTSAGTFLGIEGADGRTTLATANLAARNDLTSKIGLPDHRGSRPLPYGDEFGAWETMSSYARDIEAEDYPYIAFGLPNSPTPTINSSSAIASRIHYSGLDPTQQLPYRILLGDGLDLLEDDRILQPSSSLPAAHTRIAWLVETSPQLAARHMAPADVFLRGGDIDLIVDEVAGADIDALLLAGIAAADVGVFRTAADDLVLAAGGSEIVVEHFFATVGGGIDRVIFDNDAAWSREDLLLRAVDAPTVADFADAPLWPGFDAASEHALPADWHVEAHTAALF
jgi:hypothetical protein